MGSVNGLPFAPETPVHTVRLAYSFFIACFPITQGQYQLVCGNNPSQFSDAENLPVENVSWFDAKLFCEKLSTLTQSHFRLPSEAEWEYICRAGATTEYFFGDNAQDLGNYAWYDLNSNEQTAPVGLKAPNPWGIYDLVGNVWEWCEDVWHGDYQNAPTDGSSWMTNQETQLRRCVRGGAWNMDAFRCRSSYRSYDWNDTKTNRLGFRIVMSETP